MLVDPYRAARAIQRQRVDHARRTREERKLMQARARREESPGRPAAAAVRQRTPGLLALVRRTIQTHGLRGSQTAHRSRN